MNFLDFMMNSFLNTINTAANTRYSQLEHPYTNQPASCETNANWSYRGNDTTTVYPGQIFSIEDGLAIKQGKNVLIESGFISLKSVGTRHVVSLHFFNVPIPFLIQGSLPVLSASITALISKYS